ncbi:MAG: hypothetical protein WCR46_15615, partial [Deltaproteobacteria bacterium]
SQAVTDFGTKLSIACRSGPAGEIVHQLTAAQLTGLIRHISLEPSEILLLYRAYYTVACE